MAEFVIFSHSNPNTVIGSVDAISGEEAIEVAKADGIFAPIVCAANNLKSSWLHSAQITQDWRDRLAKMERLAATPIRFKDYGLGEEGEGEGEGK